MPDPYKCFCFDINQPFVHFYLLCRWVWFYCAVAIWRKNTVTFSDWLLTWKKRWTNEKWGCCCTIVYKCPASWEKLLRLVDQILNLQFDRASNSLEALIKMESWRRQPLRRSISLVGYNMNRKALYGFLYFIDLLQLKLQNIKQNVTYARSTQLKAFGTAAWNVSISICAKSVSSLVAAQRTISSVILCMNTAQR